MQELTNRFVREQLAPHHLTAGHLQESEQRRQRFLRHKDKLTPEETELLQDVAYLPALPDEPEKILSNPSAGDEDIQRVIAYCRHTGLFRKSYVREIHELNHLIDEIYNRNRESFADREEVFRLFVSAVITGNLLPLGKLIEKTFGKGSFRRLGKGEQLVLNSEPVDEP